MMALEDVGESMCESRLPHSRHRKAWIDLGEVSDAPAPYPKTPNRVAGSRFRAKHRCATVFGSWEESSGKSQLMEGPNVIPDHIINLVRPPDVRSAARDQDIILREDANGGPKEVSTHE